MGQQLLFKAMPPEAEHTHPNMSAIAGESFLSTPARFLKSAARRADKPGYFVRDDKGWQPTTWAVYGEQVQAAARGLLALGVQPGEVVCILGINRPEWSIMDMAAMMIGAIPAGIYWTSSAPEVAYILNHSRAPVLLIESEERYANLAPMRSQFDYLKHVIRMIDGVPSIEGTLCWSDFLAKGDIKYQRLLEDRLSAIKPDDPGTYIYTSGTTGPSKAVVLTHGNLSVSAHALCNALNITTEERVISYLPMAHVAEQMISLHNPALTGFPVYFARSLDDLVAHLREVRPTIFFGVPRVWEKMHAAIEAKMASVGGIKGYLAKWATKSMRQWHSKILDGRSPTMMESWKSSIAAILVIDKIKETLGLDQTRIAATGAAPISPEMLRFFTGLGLVIREVYGQSESCGITTLNTPTATKLGSVGRPILGTLVRIAEDGEIFVRGANVFKGYASNAAGTSEALLDGWLASGDLGHIDEQGYLFITGRKKDLLITSGGKNISPANIEADLMNTHMVEHAVVCGDGRNYLTAILTLMPEALADFAKLHNLNCDDLQQHPTVLAELQKGVEHVNGHNARVAHIRKFKVLPTSLTIEAGELTPTMKVKRKEVLEKYKEVVNSLYIE